MSELSPASSASVARWWRKMTELNITSQVDAIDYLRVASPLSRLSTAEIRGLVAAFPLLPRPVSRRRDHSCS